MMVTVEDIEKVFRFASLFYHSPLRFHEVLGFRLKMLGFGSYSLVKTPSSTVLGPPVAATESIDVVVRKEWWKLLLPDGSKYSVLVEAYYAMEGCFNLDFCLKLESALQPLWYRVEAVLKGDVGEVEGIEESTGEE
ncbi:MAG: hypothetical protein LM558_00595 [Thermosphaera sp.]|nr:hypothetical protein [Thermosphaera sp.]